MNDTCDFTFDPKKLDSTLSLFLINIHPSSVRRQPRRYRCVFSCKMRVAFILTLNLCVTPADRGEIIVFSHVNGPGLHLDGKFIWHG